VLSRRHLPQRLFFAPTHTHAGLFLGGRASVGAGAAPRSPRSEAVARPPAAAPLTQPPPPPLPHPPPPTHTHTRARGATPTARRSAPLRRRSRAFFTPIATTPRNQIVQKANEASSRKGGGLWRRDRASFFFLAATAGGRGRRVYKSQLQIWMRRRHVPSVHKSSPRLRSFLHTFNNHVKGRALHDRTKRTNAPLLFSSSTDRSSLIPPAPSPWPSTC